MRIPEFLLSIRFRLSASYVLLTLVTATLVGALTVGMVARQLVAEEEDAIHSQAVLVAEQAFQHFFPVARRAALQDLAVTSAVLGGYRVRILRADREIVADSGPGLDAARVLLLTGSPLASTEPDASLHLKGDTLALLERLSAEANQLVIRRYRASRDGAGSSQSARARRAFPFPASEVGPLRVEIARPEISPRAGGIIWVVPVGGTESPLGFVEVTSDAGPRAAALGATRESAIFAGLGAVLLAAAFGLFMSQGMTAGLRSLTDAAAEMERGTLSARARVRGRDEIGKLSQQFNRMATQLETSFRELASERDALRRFVADASHELRTPLTALMTFNELLRTSASSDESAREEFLSESRDQLERLEVITRSLLDLSRLDAGLVTLDLKECDAGLLLKASCRLWTESASRAGLRLRADVPAKPIRLLCDRGRVETVLANLLSNAVRFTPSGGEIVAAVAEWRERATVSFSVRDTGPGVGAEDVSRVFDRFYRAKDAPGGGSGLGLAIVKSIAELHGGSVSVESRAGYGSTFRVDLPARSL